MGATVREAGLSGEMEELAREVSLSGELEASAREASFSGELEASVKEAGLSGEQEAAIRKVGLSGKLKQQSEKGTIDSVIRFGRNRTKRRTGKMRGGFLHDGGVCGKINGKERLVRRNRMGARGIAAKTALYGMLVGLAFILSYVEAMIPLPLPIPGVKLGLANLVTIVGLYTVGAAGAAAVSLVRIVLAGFTFGNTFSMLYGLAGGAVSLLLMVSAKKRGWFDSMGVSILGGVGHNVGQLAVAAWVTRTAGVFYYLPVLPIAGCAAGAVIGLLGGLVTARIGKAVSGPGERREQREAETGSGESERETVRTAPDADRGQ